MRNKVKTNPVASRIQRPVHSTTLPIHRNARAPARLLQTSPHELEIDEGEEDSWECDWDGDDEESVLELGLACPTSEMGPNLATVWIVLKRLLRSR
jgi:hypothetical protein